MICFSSRSIFFLERVMKFLIPNARGFFFVTNTHITSFSRRTHSQAVSPLYQHEFLGYGMSEGAGSNHGNCAHRTYLPPPPHTHTHGTKSFASGIPDRGGQALICSSEIAKVELFSTFHENKEGEWRRNSTQFQRRRLGDRHDPATLLPGKKPGTHWIGG